jgi:putative ABC transport system permease protein
VSIVGGMIGVLVGLAGTHLVARLAAWPTLVSAPAIAVAFSFSAAVGVVFGFYPAKRAASLDPITALRSE